MAGFDVSAKRFVRGKLLRAHGITEITVIVDANEIVTKRFFAHILVNKYGFEILK